MLDIPNCLLARLLVLFSVILNRLFLQKATEQGSATYRRNYGEESTCTIHLLDVTSACKTLEFRKGYLVPVLVVERTESWFVTINRSRYIYVPFLAIPVQVAIKRNPKIMYFAHYFACKMQIAMALACRCISRVIVALLVLSLHSAPSSPSYSIAVVLMSRSNPLKGLPYIKAIVLICFTFVSNNTCIYNDTKCQYNQSILSY